MDSMPPPPSLASPSAVRDILTRYGLVARKGLGQHFLVDGNVLRRIVEIADLPPDGLALEIGPGLGTLTRALSTATGRVCAIEKDRLMLPVLEETVVPAGNVTILQGDAVRILERTSLPSLFGLPDTGAYPPHSHALRSEGRGVRSERVLPPHPYSLQPTAYSLHTDGDACATPLPHPHASTPPHSTPLQPSAPTPTIHCVSNLPYGITSPVLIALLEQKKWLASIVVMIQAEVAARLAAAPGTSDYGALSVFGQYHARVEVIMPVSRNCFFPPPDVESAIVRLIPVPGGTIAVGDEKRFFEVSRALFGQRRKTCLAALASAFRKPRERSSHAPLQPSAFSLQPEPLEPSALSLQPDRLRPQILASLEIAGIDPSRRGEELALVEIAAIADALGQGEACKAEG